MNVPSARERLDQALDRIRDPAGEGARACLTVYEDQARAAAEAADIRAKAGLTLGPLDGVIVTIKDLFDVAGEPTRAGSKVLADAPPAKADAPVVRRLRAAGAVIVAKTSMTEFAFSGVGQNPHYGVPGNPADRSRIPGGSSSGAAVAVADGMCAVAIGTDTGGSTRIPAALCGIVGFKPSRQRVPTAGAFPLSTTLDSVGPLAGSVAECALADAVLAGEEPTVPTPAPLAGLRLAVPSGLPFEHIDGIVGPQFDAALARLGRAGARVDEIKIPLLGDMLRINARGGLIAAEAYALHRELLAKHAEAYDPLVRVRVMRGADISGADYVNMARERAMLVRAMDALLEDVDGLVLPTTPIVAPQVAEMADAETFALKNALLLRNTTIANFFDLAAISLPLVGGSLPVGLMLVVRNGADKRLFRIAAAIERLLT